MVKVAVGVSAQARLLRGPRRRADGDRPGDQERVPQARAEVPPRPQPRRQGRRGAVQGGRRGVRGARRRATSARPTTGSATPASARAARGGPGFDPTIFADFNDIFGGLGDLFGFGDVFGGAAAPRRRRSAAPICATTSRSPSRRPFGGAETTIQIPREETCDDLQGQRRCGGKRRRRRAASAAGTGQLRYQQGFFTVARTCGMCRGTGRVISQAVHELPGRRARRARAEAHREDSRGHRDRPAPAAVR